MLLLSGCFSMQGILQHQFKESIISPFLLSGGEEKLEPVVAVCTTMETRLYHGMVTVRLIPSVPQTVQS